MRRQWLCGAIVILAASALAACEPYGYGPYGYGGYGPYGYGAYGPYGYGAYPYGGYPPPPPPNAAPPPAAMSVAPPPAAVAQAPAQITGPVAIVPVPCRKGALWPFVREPGDCPTDAEKFSQYPFTDYPLVAPQ